MASPTLSGPSRQPVGRLLALIVVSVAGIFFFTCTALGRMPNLFEAAGMLVLAPAIYRKIGKSS
jgi:hypothetical protein